MEVGVNGAVVLRLRTGIGAGAYTAAGATVTRDVPEDAMLIARAEQTVKPGLARRFRREKK